MAGRTGPANDAGAYGKIVYLPCRPSNGFVPEPPRRHVDLIYLCSPNNPTGAAAARGQLEAWVKYALEHKDRKSTRLNSSHITISTLSLHDALPIYGGAHRTGE